MLFEALASEAFYHLKCQHAREFDKIFFKKNSNANRCAWGNRGYRRFWNWLVHYIKRITTKSAYSSKGTYILIGKDKISKITFFRQVKILQAITRNDSILGWIYLNWTNIKRKRKKTSCFTRKPCKKPPYSGKLLQGILYLKLFSWGRRYCHFGSSIL